MLSLIMPPVLHYWWIFKAESNSIEGILVEDDRISFRLSQPFYEIWRCKHLSNGCAKKRLGKSMCAEGTRRKSQKPPSSNVRIDVVFKNGTWLEL